MSRPPKKRAKSSDNRTPVDSPRLDYSKSDDREILKNIMASMGTPIQDDDPCFSNPPLTIEEEEWLSSVSRQAVLNRARIDPLNQEPVLTGVLAEVMLGNASDSTKEVVGKMLVGAVENFNGDQAEAFFKRIVILKRNHEALPHRNGYAYLAYSRYIEEAGKEPTKAQLRKYIMARPEQFKDQPSSEDKKAWSRLWKDSGLFLLPDR